mmetsp:Transcript_19055/g.22026  ORF Transcript_19055/g.22026 Transcript_19055/m.22026 type:complete len:239 (+) Transcript_19055:126-842(+)
MSDGTDYKDIVIVALIWGVTNPILRLRTHEEDDEEGDEIDSNNEVPKGEEASLLSPKNNSADHLGNDEATASVDEENNSNNISLHTLIRKSSFDTNLSEPIASQHKSYVKDSIIQLASKVCAQFITRAITKFLQLTPRGIFESFLRGMKSELMKFRNPDVALPFLINQSSAFFYYRLIATSDIKNTSYCSALSIAIEGVVSHYLGERMSHPWRGFGGSFIVLVGVAICLRSSEIGTTS